MLTKKTFLFVLSILTLISCSYTYISPEVETRLTNFNNEKDLIFEGKKINIGDEITKDAIHNYVGKINVGSKWSYQTKFYFADKNIKFSKENRQGKDVKQFTELLNGKVLESFIERIYINQEIKTNSENSMIVFKNIKISNPQSLFPFADTSTLGDLPFRRYSMNFLFVWITTDSYSTIKDQEVITNREKDYIVYTKYKFDGTEEVIFNNKKYKGYKLSYVLNDFTDSTYYPNKNYIKAYGKSIFVKGIGAIRDETQISANYQYKDNKYYGLEYKAISELKNVTLK